AFRACNLPYVYVPLLVHPPELAKAVQAIRTYNFIGVNVTVPHKERILRYLDSLGEEAELCGAVNTVVNRDRVLFGDNTDGRGFLASLAQRGFSPQQREIVLIGAGGSTRAVLVSLIRRGNQRITIVNRTLAKAQALMRTYRTLGQTRLEAAALDRLQDPAFLKNVALVVNCTSVGLHGEPFPPVAFASTSSRCLFYDLLYHPDLTSFLRQAHSLRRPTMDGRKMLLHQGALAFSLWTGQPAPLQVMSRALARALRPTYPPPFLTFPYF